MIKEFVTYWHLHIMTVFIILLLINWILKKRFILFLSKHFKIFFIILTFPIIFMSFLYIFNDKNIGSTSDWFGFLGGYFGVIGAVGGIWWQLNEEKRKLQLGSLKKFEYYFTIISSKLKETGLENENNRFYKEMFARNLLVASDLMPDNKGYLIISPKTIKQLNYNIENLSLLDNYIDFFKIIKALEHIEETIFNTPYNNVFSKIIEKIETSLPLEHDHLIFLLGVRLKLNYLRNKNYISIIYKEKLQENEIMNLLDNTKNISNNEELISIIKDIKIIMDISLKLGESESYKILYKICSHLFDTGSILWGNENKPEIYTFEKLEAEIDKNLKIIQIEIKKIS